MSFQPSKHSSAKNQQPSFARQPTGSTHRLDFAIAASSSRSIKLGTHSATTTTNNNDNNNNGTNHKNNSKNNRNTINSSSTTTRIDNGHTTRHQGSSMSHVVQHTVTTTTNPLPPPPPLLPHYQQFATNTEQNRTPPKVYQVSLPLSDESVQQQLSSRGLSFPPTFPTHGSTIPQLLPRHDVVGSGVGYTAAEHGAGQEPAECIVKEAVPSIPEYRNVKKMDTTPANFPHEPLLKQEDVSPPMMIQGILSSYSAKGGAAIAPANIYDMSTNYLRERMVSQASSTIAAPAPALVDCGDGPEEHIFKGSPDMDTLMTKKADIERQWLGVEQQRFRLIDELQLKVQEESGKYYFANQEVKAMVAKNTALQSKSDQLQAKSDQLQAQVIALDARLSETQSLLREIDLDRAKLTEVQGQLHGQTAAQIESIKTAMATAQCSLENLSFDKAQVEIESARLQLVIQELETDRGEDLKELRTAYNETRQVSQRQFDDIAIFRTRCETHEVTIESLNAHLKQKTAMTDELRREIDTRGITIESLEVTNASLADRIGLLTQASEYQQSVLQSQLQDVSTKYRTDHKAELEKVRAERDTDKEMYTNEITRMGSSVKELQAESQNLAALNQQLIDETRVLQDEKLQQSEKVAQWQEGANVLEVENQRLLSSSMEAQSDYTDEINNTILEFENRLEEHRRRVQEREQEIQSRDAQICDLQSQIQTMTSDIEASKKDSQQLNDVVNYQAERQGATDREMLELRVKIQLLQTDHEFITKSRDDLQFELQNLQEQIRGSSNSGSVGVLARLAIGSSSLQQDPMPLTDIARLHSRDPQCVSSAEIEFSPWPVPLAFDSPVMTTSADPSAASVALGSSSSAIITPTVTMATTAMTTSSSRIATDITTTTASTTTTTSRVRTRASRPTSTTSAAACEGTGAGGSRPSPSTTVQQRGAVGGRGEEYHCPPPAKKIRSVTGNGTTPSCSRATGAGGSGGLVNDDDDDDHGESDDDDGDDEADFVIEPRANAPPPPPPKSHAGTGTSTNASSGTSARNKRAYTRRQQKPQSGHGHGAGSLTPSASVSVSASSSASKRSSRHK
ncbi:MAG: hypothetical protein J3R72DRAFT_515855 [Linnemannia gamsii]|nr:MAG: hypothetical protein J3R72DRAFT_515855 [Linnemannia gamsii]